jgi:hypothetical protein
MSNPVWLLNPYTVDLAGMYEQWQRSKCRIRAFGAGVFAPRTAERNFGSTPVGRKRTLGVRFPKCVRREPHTNQKWDAPVGAFRRKWHHFRFKSKFKLKSKLRAVAPRWRKPSKLSAKRTRDREMSRLKGGTVQKLRARAPTRSRREKSRLEGGTGQNSCTRAPRIRYSMWCDGTDAATGGFHFINSFDSKYSLGSAQPAGNRMRSLREVTRESSALEVRQTLDCAFTPASRNDSDMPSTLYRLSRANDPWAQPFATAQQMQLDDADLLSFACLMHRPRDPQIPRTATTFRPSQSDCNRRLSLPGIARTAGECLIFH